MHRCNNENKHFFMKLNDLDTWLGVVHSYLCMIGIEEIYAINGHGVLVTGEWKPDQI